MELIVEQNGASDKFPAGSKPSKKSNTCDAMANGGVQDIDVESNFISLPAIEDTGESNTSETPHQPLQEINNSNGVDSHEHRIVNGDRETTRDGSSLSTAVGERLAAAVRERDQLHKEVTELRRSLELLQQQHEEEAERLAIQIGEAHSAKEHAEGQYQKLMGRVNNIRSHLSERMKADAVSQDLYACR